MAGIASNLEARLALPGLVAEAGAVAADKGALSLFESTLSGLMPPQAPQENPDAGLSASAVAAATPMPVVATAARELIPVAAGEAAQPAANPVSPETPARRPARETVREQPGPAMNMRGTMLASQLATSLPSPRPEAVQAAADEAGTSAPASAADTLASAAASPQPAPVMPLPVPVPAAPVPEPMPAIVSVLSAMPNGEAALPVMVADAPAAASAPAVFVPAEVVAKAAPAGKAAGPAPERSSVPADAPPADMMQTAAVAARQPSAEAVRAAGGRTPATSSGPRDMAAQTTTPSAPAAITAAAVSQPAETARPVAAGQPPVALMHTPLQSPAWAHVASQRLAWMVQGGETSAVLAINPESLGPIHVRIQLDGQNARIDLAAQQPVTATLLESHLPRLTAALESQGVRVDELKVGSQPIAGDFSSAQNAFSGQQAEAGGQGARQSRWMTSAGSVSDSRQGTAETAPAVTPRRRGSRIGEVDDFA